MAENKNLLAIFKTLPEDVREWLASERATYSIIDLNKRLNITEERVKIIPRLILRLVTQDLDARDFVSTLAIKLNISDSAAKIITKEIETKILHQVEESLRVGAGVDVGMLHFGKEVEELGAEGSGDRVQGLESRERGLGSRVRGSGYGVQEERGETEQPPTETGTQGAGRGVQEEKGAATKSLEPKPSGPFILHTEKEPVKPITQSPRPTFSIKIPISQKKYANGSQAPKAMPPVTARIELGEENQISKIKYQKVEEGEQKPIEEKKMPAALPPLRRLGGMEQSSEGSWYGVQGIGGGENQISKIKYQKAEEAEKSPRPPLAIPKIIAPKPQADSQIANRQSQVGEEMRVAPQIKKVVHYSEFLTPLD